MKPNPILHINRTANMIPIFHFINNEITRRGIHVYYLVYVLFSRKSIKTTVCLSEVY